MSENKFSVYAEVLDSATGRVWEIRFDSSNESEDLWKEVSLEAVSRINGVSEYVVTLIEGSKFFSEGGSAPKDNVGMAGHASAECGFRSSSV
jgi:arginine deiminase